MPFAVVRAFKSFMVRSSLVFLIYYPNEPFCFITSVCTVDLLIPNFFAVSLTVALVWIINFATSTALSSIYVFKPSTPLKLSWLCICFFAGGYEKRNALLQSKNIWTAGGRFKQRYFYGNTRKKEFFNLLRHIRVPAFLRAAVPYRPRGTALLRK